MRSFKGILGAAALISLGLSQTAYASWQVNGFFTVAGGVLDADAVVVPQLDTLTLGARAGFILGPPAGSATGTADPLAPLSILTLVRPSIDTYNGHPDFQQDSTIGLQVTNALTDRFGITAQVVAPGNQDFNASVNWAFAYYNMDDDWRARAGLMRAPLYMYSEEIEVKFNYPWIRLPLEVYTLLPFNNNTGYSGADLTHKEHIWGYDVTASILYGSLSILFDNQNTFQIDRVQQIMGGSLVVNNDDLKLRVSALQGKTSASPNVAILNALQLYARALNPDLLSMLSIDNLYSFIGDAGIAYDAHNIMFLAEYAEVKFEGPLLADNRGYYGTLGYHFDKFTPYIGYNHMKTLDKVTRVFTGKFGQIANPILASKNTDQETMTLGARYEVMAGVDAKVEVDRIGALNGTNGLFNVAPPEHVYLYSAAIDVVF